jgi:5'-nucleotidase / UDP-sugar diphosphatase
MNPRHLALAAVALLLTACAMTPAQRAPLKLTVLHTNDHHGRFWPNSDGEYGLAARKTLIDKVRAEVKAAGGEVLLLDGGDVNTGVPESDLQDAEPDFKGMNLLGYDASAIGNHEFDKPLAVLDKRSSGRSSRCSRPTSTTGPRASACSSRTASSSAAATRSP